MHAVLRFFALFDATKVEGDHPFEYVLPIAISTRYQNGKEGTNVARHPLEFSCASCGVARPVETYAAPCSACGHVATSAEGFLDLRADPDADTLLDIETYDADHAVGVSSDGIARVYQRLFREVGRPDPMAVLEIGAGSGNLTRGLLAAFSLDRLVATDISPSFLKRLTA
ncbi:MAG: class I SAM-dependent methyltransferase [Rhodobacteraceae bacterium]|nr:class I SAM-dependent methyltransferase [Paracoccaceae bacterium]